MSVDPSVEVMKAERKLCLVKGAERNIAASFRSSLISVSLVKTKTSTMLCYRFAIRFSHVLTGQQRKISKASCLIAYVGRHGKQVTDVKLVTRLSSSEDGRSLSRRWSTVAKDGL